MTESLFREYVAKYLSPMTAKIQETINDRPEGSQPALLYKSMLTEEFTPKDTWDSASLARSVVAADVVALDSPLPLKSRGSFAKATGKIPKLGLSFKKKESDIKDIQTMIALGGTEAQIVSKLMSDVDLCVKGIEVAKEIMFLQGLSTGQTLVRDEDSDGKGIRVDFGYKPEHTFTVGKKWSEAGATPLSDLTIVLDAAKDAGVNPALMLISRRAVDRIRGTVEGKQLALRAQSSAVITDVANLPTPSRRDLLDALSDELSLEVRVIDSSFRIQNQDGSIKTVRPWEEANVVFVESNIVGRIVWGDCVEKTNPDKAVEYAEGEQGTLISVWHERDPHAEVTSGQAHAIPVIDGGSQIFLLESETVTAGSKKETKAKA